MRHLALLICKGPFISSPQTETCTPLSPPTVTSTETLPEGSDVGGSLRVEPLWRGSTKEFEDVYSHPLVSGDRSLVRRGCKKYKSFRSKGKNSFAACFCSWEIGENVDGWKQIRITWSSCLIFGSAFILFEGDSPLGLSNMPANLTVGGGGSSCQ